MKDWNALKERYLSDLLPNRLGGLSANLARIKTLTGKAISQNTIEYLIRESKFFIEWTASEMDIDQAAELVDIQRLLSRWQRHWSQIWTDTEAISQVSIVAKQASERVLEMSGLLSETTAQ